MDRDLLHWASGCGATHPERWSQEDVRFAAAGRRRPRHRRAARLDRHPFFERIAPLTNAHRITKPLFVVQGANDPRVPASEGRLMVAQVRGQGGQVWLLEAQDDGHGFRQQPNMDVQFSAPVAFVREHLLGGPEPLRAAGPVCRAGRAAVKES